MAGSTDGFKNLFSILCKRNSNSVDCNSKCKDEVFCFHKHVFIIFFGFLSETKICASNTYLHDIHHINIRFPSYFIFRILFIVLTPILLLQHKNTRNQIMMALIIYNIYEPYVYRMNSTYTALFFTILTFIASSGIILFITSMRLSFNKTIKKGFYLILLSFLCGIIMMGWVLSRI